MIDLQLVVRVPVATVDAPLFLIMEQLTLVFRLVVVGQVPRAVALGASYLRRRRASSAAGRRCAAFDPLLHLRQTS